LRLARWRKKRETCPDCGNPVEECADHERDWYGFRRVCYATAARAAAQALYDDLHKDRPFHDGSFTSWSKTRSKAHPFHHNDGVTIGSAAEDINPWDEFTTKVDASPVPPAD
jgi:hypothetical protein